MPKSYEEFFEEKAREYLAAYKIQQWWKKEFYDPNNRFIKVYLDKQYDSYNI